MARKKSGKQTGSKKNRNKNKASSKKAGLRRSSPTRKAAKKKASERKRGSLKRKRGGVLRHGTLGTYIDGSYVIIRRERDGEAGESSGMRGSDPGPSISGGNGDSE